MPVSYIGDASVSNSTFLNEHHPLSAQYTVVYAVSSSDATPVGLLMGFNIAQNRDFRRVYEVGSTVPYIVLGMVNVSFTATKLIAYANDWESMLKNFYGTAHPFDFNDGKLAKGITIGVKFYTAGSTATPVGGLKLEYCTITADSITISAGEVMIAENVSFEVRNVTSWA